MNKSKVITLRVPFELKYRLENEAKHQGVYLNNLANYFFNNTAFSSGSYLITRSTTNW